MTDFIWSERKVLDLVQGFHMEDIGDGKIRAIEASGPTYYEQRCAAYDKGEPELALDAIQLDMAVDHMTDMAAKAAMHLRIMGWDPQDVGAVIRDKRRRTGAQLLEDGVRQVVRHERRRSER